MICGSFEFGEISVSDKQHQLDMFEMTVGMDTDSEVLRALEKSLKVVGR